MNVVVDTSVWIGFLANRSPYAVELDHLLSREEVSARRREARQREGARRGTWKTRPASSALKSSKNCLFDVDLASRSGLACRLQTLAR